LESQAHDDLSKTVTSKDAQAVHDLFKQQVNSVLGSAMSDKVLARQLHVYGQQVDVLMQNTVNARKAVLIHEGDKSANGVMLDTSSREAINTMAAGGDVAPIRAAMDAKLDASVHVMGTLLPEQKVALMNKWDKDVESGYIDAMLSSPNLQSIQNTVNDIRLHPEKFPHLDKGELNAYAVKGESAIVSMMSRQKEINANAEESKYWNQSPTGIPKMFSDINGNFDAGKAADYVTHLGLSPEGEKVLLNDIKVHESGSNLELKQQATKLENGIVDAGNHHNYKEASALLDQFKQFSDQHGEFGEGFRAMSNFIDEKRSREMSLAIEGFRVHNEAYTLKKQQEQDQSWAQYGQLAGDIAQGKYTDTQLRQMTGGGVGALRPGQMLPQQVEDAIKLNHSYETDPENKKYINAIWNDAALAALPAQQGRIVGEYQAWLKKYPGATEDAKAAEVKRLIDPVHVEQIGNSLDDLNNRINGKPSDSQGWFSQWWNRKQVTPATPGKRVNAPNGATMKVPDNNGKLYWFNDQHENLGPVDEQ